MAVLSGCTDVMLPSPKVPLHFLCLPDRIYAEHDCAGQIAFAFCMSKIVTMSNNTWVLCSNCNVIEFDVLIKS